MKNAEPQIFPALTGLRAAAASLVFFFHYNPFARWGENNLFFRLVNECHIGVSLFFVLSGFLVFYRHRAEAVPFREYLLRRFARIYPLFFIFSLLQFFSPWYHFTGPKAEEVFLNLSFLKGFSEAYAFSGIPQAWSLTPEVCFYLLVPLFSLLLRKYGIRFWLLPAFILVIGLIFRNISHYFGWEPFVFSPQFLWVNTFFGRCFEFFQGMALACILPGWKSSRSKPFFTLGGVAGILAVLLALVFLKGDLKYGLFHPAGIFIHHLFLPALGILPLLYGLISEKTRLQKWLCTGWMQLLGKSSYAFFLIHIGLPADLLTHLLGLNALGKFIVLTGLSVLVYLGIEKPVNRAIKGIFSDPENKEPAV